jgi:XTP/dITP diphosphohydrolase
MSLQRIVVASSNRHKIGELRRLLADPAHRLAADVVGLDAFSAVPDIEESAPDFGGNAKLKAFGIADWLAEQGEPGTTWVLADDSGICIDAFDGAPGVKSARFAGQPSDDAANNLKMVDELQRRGLDRSPAHYVCALALVRVDGGPLPDGRALAVFEGRWDVEVRTQARGSGGFGYDPHAWLAGGARTVAELSHDEKATASHRGAAFAALVAWWRTYAATSPHE